MIDVHQTAQRGLCGERGRGNTIRRMGRLTLHSRLWTHAVAGKPRARPIKE